MQIMRLVEWFILLLQPRADCSTKLYTNVMELVVFQEFTMAKIKKFAMYISQVF